MDAARSESVLNQTFHEKRRSVSNVDSRQIKRRHKREMRRNFLSSIGLSSIMAAALLPAGSLWAAPDTGSPAAQYLNQIDEQTHQIQTQADRLEAYVRSGAHDWNSSAGYTYDMAEGAQKLLALLD
jgi:hypothetical protein